MPKHVILDKIAIVHGNFKRDKRGNLYEIQK